MKLQEGISKFQVAEWDKLHGFMVPVVGFALGFALQGDQEGMDLGFPMKLWKGCLVLSLCRCWQEG